MGSRDGTLPEHAKDGRTTFSGPLQGGYVTFLVTTDTIENSATPEFGIVAPFDMRVMEIQSLVDTIGSDPTIQIQNNGTDVVAVVTLAITAINHTIVEAQRNVAKGDILNVLINADAGDSATGLCVTITCYARGHVYTDGASD